MGVRHRGRELAFHILFQMDLTGDRVNAVIARYQELRYTNATAKDFAEELARGAAENQAEDDALIRKAADNWKLERLLSVDRALLRLGAHELARTPKTPTEVILDECIEMAKDYGSNESPAFVNGVLDRLAQSLRGVVPPKKIIKAIPKRPAKPGTKKKKA